MRYLPAAAAMLAFPAPCLAAPSGDISMVAIGLPFAPETPTPVAPTHPLYHRVAVDGITDLPATVGSTKLNFIAAAKRSSINAALRQSLERMNLLAPDASTARARLIVSWRGSHTPFRIATSNTASATLHYQLVRIDSGQSLFDREVTTYAKGGGVDASMRDNGIVRAAIAANFASAANCLDHAAIGTAPANCALTPKFSVAVVRR
jgi:hypothetical protein